MTNTYLRDGDWDFLAQAETAGRGKWDSRGSSGLSAARNVLSPVVAVDRQRGSLFHESPSSRDLRLSATSQSNQKPIQGQTSAVHGRGVVKLRHTLKIATWNVRTMRTDAKLETLEGEMKRYGIGCLGVAETRWTGVGHFISDNGSTVIYSGGTEHKYGVGVILDKALSTSLLGYNPINDRIMTVRIAASPFNLTYIQAYAPTNQASDPEKDAFYDRLEQVHLQVPQSDIVIIGGDFNAKIGEGAPTGRYALGVQNENGTRLINFTRANSLVAANCLAHRHPRRLYTWRSFDGTCRNQIDYILVPERWKSGICYSKSIQGADCDTDHSLVGLKFQLRLRRLRRPQAPARYDFSNSEQFAVELRNRFTTLAKPEASDPTNSIQVPNRDNHSMDLTTCGERTMHTQEKPNGNEDPNAMWISLRDTILETAEKTLTKKHRRKKDPWLTDETIALIELKRSCKRDSERYRELKRTVRRAVKIDKKRNLEAICEEIEQCEKTNQGKNLYEMVNKLTKKACPRANLVQSELGEMMTSNDAILKRWRQYCENLYSNLEQDRAPDGTGQPSETSEGTAEGLRWDRTEPVPSIEEIEKALRTMKPDKAVGPDGIPCELLKLGGETVTVALHRIIELVWTTGKWPDDWTESIFVPLYKKGDPTICSNYRTISLISHASKVLLKVILDRIRAKVDFEVSETQAGFRQGKGTQTHLCNLRVMTERARARRQPLYLCFVDFEKAFDSIPHNKLWKALEDMGFARHLVQLIRTLYENQRSRVRLGNSKSELFAVLKGLRQGCNLSPYLFNIMAEILMRLVLENFEGGFHIGGVRVTNLQYADDFALATSSNAELQKLVTRLNEKARELGMRVNVKKTKVMKVSDDQTPIQVTVGGEKVEEVDHFKYLGALFNCEARCDEEIRSRLLQGRERMGQLKRLWKSRSISTRLKAKLIQTLVWPIITYGAESWTLKQENRDNIEAFEMWCYRRVLRISYTEHVSNEEVLRRMNQSRQLLGRVKKRKLAYFGHVTRHPSLEKDIMLGMMPGTRRQGGQRRQFLDDITDWAGMRLPEVVTLAAERKEYRSLIHKIVKAPHGV